MPIALLGLGLGLAGAPGRGAVRMVLSAGAAFAIMRLMGGSGADYDHLFVLAWIVISALAASLWLPRSLPIYAGLFLGILAGGVAGALAGPPIARAVSAFAASMMIAWFVARLSLKRDWKLPLQVAAAWLVAVSALNATLAALPVTPGYAADHLE